MHELFQQIQFLPKIDNSSLSLFQYIKDKERILYLNDISPTDISTATVGFFGTSPKARRQGEVIQKLAEMIGSNVKL